MHDPFGTVGTDGRTGTDDTGSTDDKVDADEVGSFKQKTIEHSGNIF